MMRATLLNISETTIPKKALVALPDSLGGFKVVDPKDATVSLFDRSFHFGDSVYEVTRSYQGILFSLEEHMRRLQASADLASFGARIPSEMIMRMICDASKKFFGKFGNLDVYVRIVVSRGVSDLNIDPSYASGLAPYVFVKELERASDASYEKGVHYIIAETRRNHPAAVNPAMKSGNYMNNILAMAEAKKRGANDAILLNHQGFVTEGTTNNVYTVKNGEVWTAPLSVGILAGITRDWIFKICKDNGIPIQERLYTTADLRSADELFLSSSIKEVMPITTLDGAPVANGKPGELTKKIHKLLKELIVDYCDKNRSESLFK